MELRNEGKRTGTETVQLYTQDVSASIVRPVKELKDFRKVTLAPGEGQTLRFSLDKNKLGFYRDDGSYALEDGLFRIYAGGSSEDCLKEEVRIEF